MPLICTLGEVLVQKIIRIGCGGVRMWVKLQLYISTLDLSLIVFILQRN